MLRIIRHYEDVTNKIKNQRGFPQVREAKYFGLMPGKLKICCSENKGTQTITKTFEVTFQQNEINLFLPTRIQRRINHQPCTS